MSKTRVPSLVKVGTLVGTSIMAAGALATGYGHGMHPMPPIPPSPATMGMMPYAMPSGYAYGAPMAYADMASRLGHTGTAILSLLRASVSSGRRHQPALVR